MPVLGNHTQCHFAQSNAALKNCKRVCFANAENDVKNKARKHLSKIE